MGTACGAIEVGYDHMASVSYRILKSLNITRAFACEIQLGMFWNKFGGANKKAKEIMQTQYTL